MTVLMPAPVNIPATPPHVVIDASDKGALRCLHCGDCQRLVFPVAAPMLLATIAAFKRKHEQCQPKGGAE